MKLPVNKSLRLRARELRKNSTLSEVLLWNVLKQKRANGLDFDRQKVIGNYIVDFYCRQASLVIELDGSQHFTDRGEAYDNIRTEVLEKYGLSVLRISNLDITKNFSGVCECINDSLSHLR